MHARQILRLAQNTVWRTRLTCKTPRIFALMVWLCTFAACTGPGWHVRAAYARCSGVDYGSGMVATVLPKSAVDALRQAHETVHAHVPALVSDYLKEAPFAPQISLIYDVTAARTTPAQQALHAYLGDQAPAPLRFGDLAYWNDVKGGKTTVVVAIEDAQGQLTHLHDALAQATHIHSCFAYHPHATLAYLPPHARLPTAVEQAILGQLQLAPFRVTAFYITNACGERVACEEAP